MKPKQGPTETQVGSCGTLLDTNPFCVHHLPSFLFAGNRLHSASLAFPEFQRADSISCSSRKGGNAETKEDQGRNNSAVIKQVLVSPQGIYIFLRSLSGTKVPTPIENGNFRLSTRFLGNHHAVASPPTNQKKVICPAAITPNFAFKNSYPK